MKDTIKLLTFKRDNSGMIKVYTVIGAVCLFLIIIVLCRYIYSLKREIRRFDMWIKNGEHIYYVDLYDKDIESLAYSINQRIRLEEKKEQEIERRDKSFKKLAADLSHDLRTPITVISGYLQLLRLENNLEGNVCDYITHLEKKTIYLKKLVDDIYMLFWSEAIHKELDMYPMELVESSIFILKEYIENSRTAAETLNIHIHQQKLWIIGNEKYFTRILCNLLDNALKYSSGMIDFAVLQEGQNCQIQISNPADFSKNMDIQNIFELFYTEDEGNNSSGGIGLYTTKKLVKNLKGNIYATYEKRIFSIIIKFPIYSKKE